LSCEVETSCARQRLLVRGGDSLCEAEKGSSSGKLVGDAANWLKTGRLASEGLDQDLHTTTQVEHQVNGGLLLDVVVCKGTVILKLLASEQRTPPRG
jgi:ribosomal protein S3